LKLDGGSGIDTVNIAALDPSIDFALIADNKFVDIENLDLSGSNANTVKLGKADVLAFSDTTNTLLVKGDTGDTVTLSGSGWIAGAIVTDPQGEIGPYVTYTDGQATVLIEQEIHEINQAPTAVEFANATTVIAENTDTTLGIKVADIVVVDDALGSETLTVIGADAASFEIVGSELRLKAGVLDFETKASYAVQVTADDPTVGGTPDATSAVFTVSVTESNDIDLATLTAAQGFRIFGVDAVDVLGWSVSSAGDVNGDGFDDLMLGAPEADAAGNAKHNAGESYVIFGGGVSVADIDLATLTAGQGFRIFGVDVNDYLGYSVSSAGDVNGDGFTDLIIGAQGADAAGNAKTLAGESYVIFGHNAGFADIDLAALQPSQGFRILGADVNDTLGHSVSSAGDVNGDGFTDLIVGAPLAGAAGSARGFAGDSYVIFGGNAGFADIDLAALSLAQGFRILGADAVDDSGQSVSSAGDVNGDGFDDVIVGAPFADAPGNAKNSAGESYVIFGGSASFADIDLAALTQAQGFRIFGAGTNDYSGRSVSSAGDVNGDGFADLIVGASGGDAAGDAKSETGESYVLFGGNAGFADIDLAALTQAQGFRIFGAGTNDYSGRSVSSAGDVNGDGFSDLIVGASGGDAAGNAKSEAGESYVIFGTNAGFADIDLATLTPAQGFRIFGADANDWSGYSVSSAGDVNGDGFDDLIVGAPNANILTGESYVIFGGNFTGVVTHLGTSSADALTASAAAEVLIGGLGSDTLDGAGGIDVLKGAGGDDALVFDWNDRVVDGGSGEDTLQFTGFGESLDLTDIIDTRYTGIEIVDLTGTGDNSLTLETLDLLNLSDSTNTLRVDGDSGDSVISTGQGWVAGGTVDVGGTLYQSYTDGAATLLLHADVDSGSLIS
jgi:hypothetical protein